VHAGRLLREAIITAIGLGGDVDTVAALNISDADWTAALAEGLVALWGGR
jgi:ADP-ribosylglycohydrolase